MSASAGTDARVTWDARGFFRVALHGRFDVAAAVTMFDALYEHPAHRAGAHVLYDIRDADFALFEARRLKQLSARVTSRPRADRAAVGVERDLDFGIMRQWFAYSENGHGRRELFRALAPAEAWLAQ